jgi:hypothetical protein
MDNLTCAIIIIIIIIIAASVVQFSNCKFFPPNPTAHNWLALQSFAAIAAVAVVDWGRRGRRRVA